VQAAPAFQYDARVARVLIVEDGEAVSESVQIFFEANGIEGVVAPSPSEALAMIERGEFGVVIQDMRFPPVGASGGRGGLELFRRLRAIDPELPVLVLCAGTSLPTAVQLVQEGASDYLAEPWDDIKLLAGTRTLLRLRELQVENARLKAERVRVREAIAEPSGPDAAWPAPPARDTRERRRLEQALRDAGGVVAKAAMRLGLSRQALYRRMARLGIALERRLKV
jgi:DNA-binding NtrC family response regulator